MRRKRYIGRGSIRKQKLKRSAFQKENDYIMDCGRFYDWRLNATARLSRISAILMGRVVFRIYSPCISGKNVLAAIASRESIKADAVPIIVRGVRNNGLERIFGKIKRERRN